MNTPIYDFVKNYIDKNSHHLHMPGHKGVSFLGCEHLDLTEIEGADYLYNAKGIIRESMDIATQIFGTHKTFYSTEGSSLSIKAMLKALDPHSTYTDPKETKALLEQMEGSFGGIGIQFNIISDTLYVIQTTLNGPAERAGLLP
ncbi:MAG: hypothetical protein IKT35_00375, partial [Clostridia bacterium]|nr:hypothetical protein [Clostridia bacterium]